MVTTMTDDVSKLSYEAALAELDGIISQLERGDVALEQAIQAYERGMALQRHCAALLDATEQKVTQLVVSNRGEVESPLEVDGTTAAPAPAPAAMPRARSAEQALFGEPPPAASRGRGGAAVDPDDIPF